LNTIQVPEKTKKRPAQKERLREWLDTGKPITRMMALVELGIFELSRAIISLEAERYPISKRRFAYKNQYNETTMLVEYRKGSA
jgi:hypothetical protein